MWYWIKATWEFCGSDSEALAQLSHIGWGGFLTLAFYLHFSLWVSIAIVLTFAVLKEISEIWTETRETAGSLVTDVLFWWIGIVLAGIIVKV